MGHSSSSSSSVIASDDASFQRLSLQSYPKSQGDVFYLSDKRQLGFLDVNPHSKAKIPTLLIPGLPSTRFFHHPKLDSEARLIVLERPGLGLSSIHPNHQFLDFAEDVKELVKEKNWIPFNLIGYSAGGPFALAIVHELHECIHRVAIISSICPHNAPHVYKGMPLLHKLAWFSTAHFPSLLKRWVSLDAKKTLEEVLSEYRSGQSLLPACDQEKMKDPEVEFMFCDSEMEILSRYQMENLSHEYELWGKPWGFELKHLKAELRIYHGTLDVSTTIGMGRYLADQIGCPLIEFPNHGHMLYFDVFLSVLEWLSSNEPTHFMK